MIALKQWNFNTYFALSSSREDIPFWRLCGVVVMYPQAKGQSTFLNFVIISACWEISETLLAEEGYNFSLIGLTAQIALKLALANA